jgi:hypothetical protein
LRAPWKKNRTINTCSPAIATIMRDSMTEKLKMRFSVLLTVLKLRFSRVRKYFWLRLIVDSWPEILKMESSRAEVCSGVVPCFVGSVVRDSFSTCASRVLSDCLGPKWKRNAKEGKGGGRVPICGCRVRPYGNLKVYHLVRKGRHLVVEADSVIAFVPRRKDEIPLPLLGPCHHDLFPRPDDAVVDIE